MKQLAKVFVGVVLLGAVGCGTGHIATSRAARDPAPKVRRAPAHTRPAPVQALVTAQTENRLLVVALPSGRVLRRIRVPVGSDYVDAERGVVVVVSSDPGAVTLLSRQSLRAIKVIHGLSSPHIPAISPDGQYAYVTEDGSGKLDAIGLYNDKLISRALVGPGAHHLAFSTDENQVWVALGQEATAITLLSTVTRSGEVDPGHPRVVGSFNPPFLAHDLLFSPGGREVWVTSADTDYVGVFSARTRRLLFRVPAGAPPQHLVFANGSVYITSGYGSSIERVDPFSGRVIKRASAPYGSFDLDAAGDYVATASLLRGTLAIYDKQLRLIRIQQLAPSTEDVALSRP